MPSGKSKTTKSKARKQDATEAPKRRVKDLAPKATGDVKGGKGHIKVPMPEPVIISNF